MNCSVWIHEKRTNGTLKEFFVNLRDSCDLPTPESPSNTNFKAYVCMVLSLSSGKIHDALIGQIYSYKMEPPNVPSAGQRHQGRFLFRIYGQLCAVGIIAPIVDAMFLTNCLAVSWHLTEENRSQSQVKTNVKKMSLPAWVLWRYQFIYIYAHT